MTYRLQKPALLLAALLQILPLARTFLANPATAANFAFILRWGIGAGAVLGSVDAVSGATSVFTSPSTFTGSVGNYFSNNVTVSIGGGNTAASQDYFIITSGGVSSPTLANNQSTTIGLPPGLTFKASWVNNATTIGGVIYGTPTTPGAYPSTVTVVSPGNASLSQNITITISGSVTPTAPAITTPPVAANVIAGKNATFTVTASGTAPLGWFWLKNGNLLANTGNISGANTTTLTVASVSATDAANYSVIVSNNVGSVTSAPVALTIILPPAITSQPAAQTQAVGGSATFSVTATGSAPLNYRWLKNGTNLANGAKYSGVSSSALTVAALATTDAGNYSVVITNLAGSLTSSVAPLTVVSSPTITTPPANVSVTAGANASFTVVAAGSTPLVYQWLKNNSPLANGGNVSGATTATLNLSAVTTSDVANYSVAVSNSLGGVISPAATLTVAIPPAIITSPADATVTAGSNVSFTVTASGTAPLSYQWFKNNVKISGATSATLTLANVSATDAATYSAAVTNAVGTATSAAATLTVQSAPVIVTQPASQFGALGSAINLSVTAAGSAPLNYQWFKGGAALADDANISGSTSNLLTIAALTTNEVDTYFVVVSNFLGSVTSTNAVVSVNVSPVITTPPANQTVAQNSQVVFTVTATGSDPLTYQWLKNGIKLANSGNISGVNTAALTLANVQAINSGSYSVVVSNNYGSATSVAATLTVLAAPVITTSPASRSAKPGATTIFAVTATGSAPLSYQWFKNGVALADGGNISGATTGSLSISALTTNDAAVYFVTVSNLVGSATSGNATLTLLGSVAKPVILAHPTNQTAIANHDVVFSVQVAGSAPMSFQWRKGNKAIPGATNIALRLVGVKTNDAATYSVVVKNPAGRVTSKPAKLTVWMPPVFIVQAPSRTATNGQTTVFKATVLGSKPISYQWFKNGVALVNGGNISGARTAALTVAGLHRSDGGVYFLRATNMAGTITSSNAVLTVKPVSRPDDNNDSSDAIVLLQASAASTPTPPTLQITTNPDGSITLAVVGGQPGADCILEATDALTTPTPWSDLGTNRVAEDGSCLLSDPHAAEHTTRFYRVRSQ